MHERLLTLISSVSLPFVVGFEYYPLTLLAFVELILFYIFLCYRRDLFYIYSSKIRNFISQLIHNNTRIIQSQYNTIETVASVCCKNVNFETDNYTFLIKIFFPNSLEIIILLRSCA